MKAVISLRTLALLLGVAVLASCGDGDGDDAPADGPPTKAAYVKRVNATCVQLGADIEKLASRSFGEKAPTAAQLRAYTSAGARLQTATVAKLRKLTPPAGDAATVAAILDAMARAFDSVAALADGPGRPGQEPAAIGEFQRLAKAYGLTDCAAG